MESSRNARQRCLIGALLVVATVAAFWPVLQNGFVNYDDPDYVTENAPVRAGLTAPGAAWAFATGHAANWHPLTWLSHMLDVQLFGLNPGGHHAVNLLLHVLNALLLFTLLTRLTGQTWRSAVVAGLFALHPAHVQSVAWIAERKDVLSGMFMMMTLWAYAAWTRVECRVSRDGGRKELDTSPCPLPNRGGEGKHGAALVASPVTRHSSRYYWLALVFFGLGLMSKPMLVTLPCVMLLLNFWPLRRVTGDGWRVARPLTPALSPGGGEGEGGARSSEFQLSAFVPLLREKIPFFVLAVASCVITVLVQRSGGAVESLGHLSFADRLANAVVAYTRYVGKMFWPTELAVYYPMPGAWPVWQISLSAVVVVGVSCIAMRLLSKRRYFFVGWFWFVGTLVPVIGLVQVGGQSLADRYTYLPFIGLFIAVVWGLSETVERLPGLKRLLCATAILVMLLCAALTNREARRWHDSESLFRRALAVTRDNPIAHFSLGKALDDTKRFAEAIPELEAALKIAPGYAKAHGELALAHEAQGDVAAAIQQYEMALAADPNLPEALNNLAWLRATSADAGLRDGAEAARLAERACALTGYEKTILIGTLAAAYAEAGRFEEAIVTAQRAIAHAELWKESELAARNRELLELYRSHRAFHETETGRR
ncbi:MAG: tetratricopeptide repeat protein [Verrucomicrobia bacterium]|nr:MAG: tetratricopeptide repeat protein [Verrucomicrobiota bacterium]